MCKKVVEYGVSCVACGAWFHGTEQCCGDILADAFSRNGSASWCCLNCLPGQKEAVACDQLKPPALLAELADWRRAFRIMADACAGCGRKVGTAAALRCKGCSVAFHATVACTGLSAAQLALAAQSRTWECPSCMVRKCGTVVHGAVVCDDVSNGQEPVPIPLINEVDNERLQENFEYAKQVVWRNPRSLEQRSKLPIADWGGRCIGDEACSFLPASGQSQGRPVRRTDVSGSAYNPEGCLMYARDSIFECNHTCTACDAGCYNRVVGRGVAAQLQVFKTRGRGWGVRSRHPLHAGSFICEYTGEMLLDSDAEAAGLAVDDSYLFNLDGEEKGQVSKRRRTGNEQAIRTGALTEKNPELCVDASRIGSVARFLNHCCEPNLFVQSVFVEYSRRVHRIAIFAARDIVPYEELTYDYGYVVGSVKDKTLKCLCGAQNCRGYLF